DAARLEALESDPSLGPSLYLYRWAAPTISLGYAQREERVLDRDAVRHASVPVVRRPTGGRAILHVEEWTYGVAVPLEHPRLGGGGRGAPAGAASGGPRAAPGAGVGGGCALARA